MGQRRVHEENQPGYRHVPLIRRLIIHSQIRLHVVEFRPLCKLRGADQAELSRF